MEEDACSIRGDVRNLMNVGIVKERCAAGSVEADLIDAELAEGVVGAARSVRRCRGQKAEDNARQDSHEHEPNSQPLSACKRTFRI